MKGSRTKNKDKAKIISKKIKDPSKTLKELEKETGIPQSTISDIIKKDIPKVRESSEIIQEIIANDMEAIKNMAEIAKRFTEQIKNKDKLERADIAVANSTVESSFKRKQLLTGGTTENVGLNINNILDDLIK